MENKENKENNEEFENIEKKDIENMQKQEISTNEYFFTASLAQSIGSAGAKIGKTIGGALDSIAKAGRKLKSTFSKENMRSVGNKIKYATSKEGLRNAGKKISNAGSSIKTKALGLRVSSNMNSFYMLKLKDVLEKYSGSNDNEDFALKIQESMKDYEGFVSEKIKLWLNNNEEREKALGDKIKVGYDELKKKYDNLDYKWLEKKIPSFSKKIRIEILKKRDCIDALKNHLGTYGKIDPLWDILTRGSKITRSGALKSKTINLLFTMTDSLSTYAGDNPMDVGVYSNSLMSYLLKNFKGKGEDKGQDWKLKCGLLLVRYSQQEGSYFESLGKMVDERVNKIQKSISITKQLSKLQKSCKTIPEMLDKASGSKKGTASIAIGVGMSYSNSVAIDVLKRVYTSLKLDEPNTKDIQDNSADSINDLVDKIKEIIGDNKISQYDTNPRYKKWADSLFKIVNIGNENGILNTIKYHQHLKNFKNEENEEEAFKKYMQEKYKKIRDQYEKTLKEYEDLLEELKKDLEKYSGDDFGGGTNPSLFEMAKKNLERFKYMLSDKFIEDEINNELKDYNTKKAENKTEKLKDYNTKKVKNKKNGTENNSDSGKKSEIKNKEEKKSENNSDSAKESEINNQDVNNLNEEKKSKDNSDSEKEEEKEKEIKNEEVPNLKEEKEVKNETKSDSNSEQEKNKEEIKAGSNSEKGKAINESSSKEENEKEKASNSEEKEEVETDKSSSNSVDGKKKSDI